MRLGGAARATPLQIENIRLKKKRLTTEELAVVELEQAGFFRAFADFTANAFTAL